LASAFFEICKNPRKKRKSGADTAQFEHTAPESAVRFCYHHFTNHQKSSLLVNRAHLAQMVSF
jgi:hypothetical protein